MFKVTLKEPIKHGTETIETLEFAPLKAKQMRELPLQPDMDDLLTIAGDLCAQPPSVINELCAADAMKVIEYLGNELGNGARTGKKR